MNSAMQDFKPYRESGYTGNRHDDKPAKLSAEQAGIIGFIAGMLLVMTISLVVGGV